MYGLEHGLLIAVARGASKTTAKQACSLEPLSFADVMIAPGKAHAHLAVATPSNVKRQTSDVERKAKSEKRKLGALVVGGAFADLCLTLLKAGIADKRIFELWQQLLSCLADLPQEPTAYRSKLLYAAAALKLLKLLGYGPSLNTCLSCRREIEREEAKYSLDNNGVLCTSCATRDASALFLEANALSCLRLMESASFPDLLPVSIPTDALQKALNAVRLALQHAPLDREPHGLVTIERIMNVRC